MTTYAIGDLQGCYDALARLLDTLAFDPKRDRLWFAGDLVNRGPQSLACLRFVRNLGDAAVTVLGNHDLHLLAVAAGGRRGRRDTLDEVLKAPDREELLDWLRRQPLLHVAAHPLPFAGERPVAMLHAGLPPQWDLPTAQACAEELQAVLRGDDYRAFLAGMYGNEPTRWSPKLRGMARLRFIVNAYTRLRYCDTHGHIDTAAKGAPGSQPPGLLPWFAVPERRSAAATLLCGHWSTLGRVHWPEYAVYGLDTGCIWGGPLTALCLDDGRLHSIDCAQQRDPHHDGD